MLMLELDVDVKETLRCAFLCEKYAPKELGHNHIALREQKGQVLIKAGSVVCHQNNYMKFHSIVFQFSVG